MATARKLPSGNWRCLVFSHIDEQGKKKYVSFTASTKAEAQRLAAEFAARKDRERSSMPDLTVGEALDKYFEIKKNVLSPSTKRGYNTIRRNYIRSIERKRISTIKDVDLQEVVNQLAATKSSKTVRNAYGLISTAISTFTGKDYKVTLPQKDVIVRNIPIDTQVQQLMELADEELRLCIALAAVGTLRLGEVCGLLHRDVFRDQNTIYVHGDMIQGDHGYVYKEKPKTSESERTIPLPPEVIALIPDGKPNDYIIKHSPSTIDKHFRKLKQSIGLKCRFHDLRAYSASIMHAIGIPDVYIMKRGGWKTDTVLKDIYRNSLDDKAIQFNDQINDYISQNVMPNNALKSPSDERDENSRRNIGK